MRFMLIVKASAESEAGVMPEDVPDMMRMGCVLTSQTAFSV